MISIMVSIKAKLFRSSNYTGWREPTGGLEELGELNVIGEK